MLEKNQSDDKGPKTLSVLKELAYPRIEKKSEGT
jgi:hypothetical protein